MSNKIWKRRGRLGAASVRRLPKKFFTLGRDAWENGLGYNYRIPLDGCWTQGPRVSLVWTLLNLYNACVRRMDHPCREVSLDAASSTLRSRARTKYSIGPSSRLDSIPGRIWHQVWEPAFSSSRIICIVRARWIQWRFGFRMPGFKSLLLWNT